MKTGDLWDFRKSYYMTYAEVDAEGNKKPEVVARALTFEQARQTVDRLGFGYSMHPHKKD